MATLSVFNFMTLNGFYKGPNEDISWHKNAMGKDENEFSANSLKANNTLIFGRVTYDMMASYWPTTEAIKNDPKVAKGMNKAEKIVFSKSLKTVDWNNTKIVSGDIVAEMKKMKNSSEKNMTILGSGSIVTQFAEEGLIDEYTFMVDPLAIGKGTPIFNNIKHQLDLELTRTQTFRSGVVLLSYQPMEK